MMMKSMLKLIRRSLLLLLISMFLLLIFNGVFFISVTASHNSGGSIWTAAETVADSLSPSSDGLRLSEEGRKTLKEYGAWAILIEDKSGNTIWESDNLPEEIPDHYSAAEIARAVNGYICDYPTSFSRKGDHLLILGLPKTGYWKLMWPAFDYNFIANLPKLLLIGLLCNLGIVSLIYFLASSGIFRSVKPILKGIQDLPEGKEVYVRERGLLSELASSINQSAEKLRSQEHSLKKKETARANWIAGYPHTPFHDHGVCRAVGRRRRPLRFSKAEGRGHPQTERKNTGSGQRFKSGVQAGIQHAAPAPGNLQSRGDRKTGVCGFYQ